ncbi:GAF domain-like protein [Radiomyces spectabilis]|uniref:GAF domain-like protein n=1 Tax=Radiomyces spectabilis TaxID=64574 RepID=UPI00221E8C97|nr:GAF domain-like protein [Radiomyces spectabilis]KAI8373143.1 GAF domain-like protein [Radiomyces spectabilis]
MKDIPRITSSTAAKSEFYPELLEQIKAITEDQSYWVTNLSNAAAIIYHELRGLAFFQAKPINWAGFYLVDPNDDQKLILGPFQGKVACTEIPFSKGVCGAAATTRTTQVIKDVHQFPGHIACDSASNSEIVVPLVKDGRLLGVLDIDCEETEGFDECDQAGLEAVAKVIIDNCAW